MAGRSLLKIWDLFTTGISSGELSLIEKTVIYWVLDDLSIEKDQG